MNKEAGGPEKTSILKLDRRDFLAFMSFTLGGIAATIVGIPVIGALVSPFFSQPPEAWRGVGKVDDFKVGETVEVNFEDPSPLPWAGVSAKTAAWLRRVSQDQFTAFSIDCTHLGCPVRWLPSADLFMCPCHGGVYYKDGTVAAGPPPKPLVQYPVRINQGEVEVQTHPLPITTS